MIGALSKNERGKWELRNEVRAIELCGGDCLEVYVAGLECWISGAVGMAGELDPDSQMHGTIKLEVGMIADTCSDDDG